MASRASSALSDGLDPALSADAKPQYDVSEDQHLLVQDMRLRGTVGGVSHDERITYYLKLEVGGVKSKTAKAARKEGQVQWEDKCLFDVLGENLRLRARVFRSRRSDGAANVVDSVIAECNIHVPQLKGTDRSALWGWHKLDCVQLAKGEHGELYLGVERFLPQSEVKPPNARSRHAEQGTSTYSNMMEGSDVWEAAQVIKNAWRCRGARAKRRQLLKWRESMVRNAVKKAEKTGGAKKRKTGNKSQTGKEGAASLYSYR